MGRYEVCISKSTISFQYAFILQNRIDSFKRLGWIEDDNAQLTIMLKMQDDTQLMQVFTDQLLILWPRDGRLSANFGKFLLVDVVLCSATLKDGFPYDGPFFGN